MRFGIVVESDVCRDGGMSEIPTSAVSSFVRIFMVPYGIAGLRFWIPARVEFYNELRCWVSLKTVL